MSPYKNRDKQRVYQRNWQRERCGVSSSGSDEPTLEWRLETAQDLKAVLESVINELMPSDLDLGVKGQVIAQLLTVGCKLLEVGDIERRLDALEARMLPVGGIRK
jgi:hypothetical protein